MTFYDKISFASRAAALALLLFAVGCGRDEKASPAEPAAGSVGRMGDKEYREQLKGHIESQKSVATEINEIKKQMELQRRRARLMLGEKATEEQILAELESKPVKYPEWGYLKGRLDAAMKSMEKRRAETRASVLARIAKEKQSAAPAAKPVKSGK